MASGLNMRQELAINSAKLSSKLIKTLRLGEASSLPGRVALALNPSCLKTFATTLNHESQLAFFITGTNGKTTSTGLLKQICIEAQGHSKIICNDFGANLYYGICTELVRSSDYQGKLKSSSYVLEVDEATLPRLALDLKPRILTVTNLYRDQLDRFGEIDSTQKLIIQGIQNILQESSAPLTLILNADDPKVSAIADHFDSHTKIKVIFYSVEFSSSSASYQIQDLDSSLQATNKRKPDIKVYIDNEAIEYSDIHYYTGDGKSSANIQVKLPGLYNVYNAAAAISSALVAGISADHIKAGIERYHTAFGRSEVRTFAGKQYQSFLIKNPTGCSEVLRHLSKDLNADFMIAINDNYADGRDVSWLWDAQFEYLNQLSNAQFLCSGHRAYDMALRLKYAGIHEDHIRIEPRLKTALQQACRLSPNKNLYLLPTYTALLELNKI